MTVQALDLTCTSRWCKIGSTVAHDTRGKIPRTPFFLLGFNPIVFTERVFLVQYLIPYAGLAIATTGALIVGMKHVGFRWVGRT